MLKLKKLYPFNSMEKWIVHEDSSHLYKDMCDSMGPVTMDELTQILQRDIPEHRFKCLACFFSTNSWLLHQIERELFLENPTERQKALGVLKLYAEWEMKEPFTFISLFFRIWEAFESNDGEFPIDFIIKLISQVTTAADYAFAMYWYHLRLRKVLNHPDPATVRRGLSEFMSVEVYTRLATCGMFCKTRILEDFEKMFMTKILFPVIMRTYSLFNDIDQLLNVATSLGKFVLAAKQFTESGQLFQYFVNVLTPKKLGETRIRKIIGEFRDSLKPMSIWFILEVISSSLPLCLEASQVTDQDLAHLIRITKMISKVEGEEYLCGYIKGRAASFFAQRLPGKNQFPCGVKLNGR